MKTVLTLLLFICALPLSYASTAELFTYDRAAVDQKMEALSRVESYVESHQDVTLDQLEAEGNSVLSGLNITGDFNNGAFAQGPLGIPSFLWGCILSWVGILIVYLITEDSEETKKALWGCLTTAISGCLIYVVFWMLILGGAFGSMYWY